MDLGTAIVVAAVWLTPAAALISNTTTTKGFLVALGVAIGMTVFLV